MATKKSNMQEEYTVRSEDIAKKVKELIKEGNVRKIIIKNEHGESIMELPMTIAVIGTVLAPILAAVGALAAMMTNCTIVVERKK